MPAPERMPLDDILSDQEPQAPAADIDKAPPATEVSAERADRPSSKRSEHRRKEYEAQGRDPDTGQFKPKEPEAKADAKEPGKAPEKAQDKSAPAAQPEMTERERGLLRAAEDERSKRQALERRLAEAGTAKTAQPAAEPKKFWDDPEGHFKSAEQRQQAIATQGVLRTSEIIARSRYQDFDEKIKVFGDLVGSTPGLGQQWLAAADPAEFAYKLGKNHLELRQAGNIDKLRADIEAKARADERAKVEAEYKAKAEEADRKRADLPGSLSDIRGAGSTKTSPAWGGPTSLTDILKH